MLKTEEIKVMKVWEPDINSMPLYFEVTRRLAHFALEAIEALKIQRACKTCSACQLNAEKVLNLVSDE